MSAEIKRCSSCLDFKDKNNDFFVNQSICKECKKDYDNEKIGCECGRTFARKNKSRHLQTNMHKKLINMLNKNVIQANQAKSLKVY